MPVILVQEQHLGPFGTTVLGVLVGGGLMVIALVPLPPPARMVAFFVLVLLLAVWLVFRRLTVIVTDRELRVGFPMFRSRVPLAEIVATEALEPLSIWRTGGFGLRLTLDGKLAYYVRHGRAVRIARRRGLDLLVGTDDPEALISAIRRATAETSE